MFARVPDAVQRVVQRNGARLIRDPGIFGIQSNRGPGSAAHHFVLRCARDKRTYGIFFTGFGSRLNSRAALPPRMLRLACSLRNGRS
jgi:hypothetical protein